MTRFVARSVVVVIVSASHFLCQLQHAASANATAAIVVGINDQIDPISWIPLSPSFFVVTVSRTNGAALLMNDYHVRADSFGKPDFESKNDLAQFSSMGPTNDGRMKPDLTAPGTYVFSAYSDAEPYSFQCRDTASGAGAALFQMSGTSMATPIVAGAAALVRQYLKDGYYPSGRRGGLALYPSSALMRAILINSAVPLNGNRLKSTWSTGIQENQPLSPTPSFEQGYVV